MAVGGALFGNSRGGANSSKALVEFRAGKMTVSGSLVTADKRKGLIQVEQGEDSLMHFKWKDRGTGLVEDDLIIFPDDIEFLRVNQCKDGRVFVLKFTASSRRMFFWMQEPKEDKDEEYCKKVNDSLNKPGSTSSGADSGLGALGSALGLSGQGGRSGGIDLSNLGDSGLQSLLGSMSQQQLAQLFGSNVPLRSGGVGGRSRNPPSGRTPTSTASAARESAATATPAASKLPPAAKDAASTSSGAAGNVPIQLTDLQSVLSGIRVPDESKEPPVDLSVGVTGEVIKPLLTNPDFVDKMKRLMPSNEQEEGTETVAGNINSTVKSPQFKQALQLFSSGLQSGQLAPLIREFDLGDDAVAAAAGGNLEAFVKAISDKHAKKPDDDMGGLD